MAEVSFKGECGRIEGRFHRSSNQFAPSALVLHPHPLYGGSMNNTVVYNMYKILANFNFNVLRINFRGVGKSVGKFANGIGEVVDAAVALDWLESETPKSEQKIVLGFSFGAWIAMQIVMRRPEIIQFIIAAPPIDKYDFSFLAPCPVPGLVIQGDIDSVVSEASVKHFATNVLTRQKNVTIDYQLITGADHFFRNKISEFNDILTNYIQKNFSDYVGPSEHSSQEKSRDKIYL